jgi:hypothetical protein
MCLARFHAIWNGSDTLSTLPRHVGGLGVCGVTPQAILQQEGPSGRQAIVKFAPIGPKTELDFVGAGYQDRSSPDKSEACQQVCVVL